jgi:hypothetical protein
VLNCCLFHAYSSALKIEVTCSSKMFVWLSVGFLHGLSLRVNYTEQPPLVSEVNANFCG